MVTLSIFLAEVINILRNNSSLWRFQAKDFFFTVTFIINTLSIIINQKNIMQTVKGNYVSVRIG